MAETLIKEPENVVTVTVSNGIYARYIKRFMDFFLSLCAVTVLSPILLILTIIGAIVMKGNPFFVQERPGKNEKIFKLIKFRTMTCEKGKDGKLLPDNERLTKYGAFLRSTSLDELPELFNILKGDMSIIGPRPLLPEYLPYYTDTERHRHDVRPGLSGLAQANGRNIVSWDKRINLDLYYVSHISFLMDFKIICKTISIVFRREGISVESMENFDDYRKKEILEQKQ